VITPNLSIMNRSLLSFALLVVLCPAHAQWITIPSGTMVEFDAVLVDDASNYWVGGTDGLLMRTTDGGATWNSQTLPGAGDLEAIIRLNATTLLIAADDGRVIRSTDNGAIWNAINTGAPNVLYDITHHGDLVWASGRDGGLVHSTDQGQSWTVQASNTNQRLHGIKALSATEVVAVGRNGVLLRTSDGGDNWQLSTVSGGDDHRALIFLADPQRTGLIAGPAGGMLRSTDHGASWNTVAFPSNHEAQAFASEDPSVVYAVGDFALILRSTDQGQSWQSMTSPAFSELSGVSVKDGVAVAVGANGTIIKLGQGQQSVGSIEAFGSLSVFPNPSEGAFTIEWASTALDRGNMIMEVLLSDGRLVDRSTWPDGRTHLHIGYLPAGGYIIRMISSEGVQVQQRLVVTGG
jgi:photosystem II stability/assembly factor-like uncharacterized protein